jgi:hypothetical protein
MYNSTLYEGALLLFLSGVGVVVWWGIRRLVKMSDDNTNVLTNINATLSLMCERLSKTETWMNMHEKSDDERHREIKESYKLISSILIDKNGG